MTYSVSWPTPRNAAQRREGEMVMKNTAAGVVGLGFIVFWLAIVLTLWVTIGYVAVHFIWKFW
jgi:hypothetical protein